MNKSIVARLRSVKDHPEFGGMGEAAKLRMKRKLWDAIGLDPHAGDVVDEYVPGYATFVFSQYISRPVMAGAFSLVVIAGGWLTSVRAADSLPGQTLYSIKLITEQAQLKLASLDRKAILHTEFAGRRLQEISDLKDLSADESITGPLVRETIEAYKQEVASASENLQQLQSEGDAATLATASSVQENLQALNTDFDAVVGDPAVPASPEVIDAKAVTKEGEEAATAVVVEVHEQDQSELSANELKQIFKADLGDIEARKRFDLERVAVIRLALEDQSVNFEGFDIPTADDLTSYEYTITSTDAQLFQAMTYLAIGGYRTAFEMMQDIDQSLLDLEATLASIEINIMTARAQTPAVAEPEPELEDNLENEQAVGSGQ